VGGGGSFFGASCARDRVNAACHKQRARARHCCCTMAAARPVDTAGKRIVGNRQGRRASHLNVLVKSASQSYISLSSSMAWWGDRAGQGRAEGG
jgi:hypothetical protein